MKTTRLTRANLEKLQVELELERRCRLYQKGSSIDMARQSSNGGPDLGANISDVDPEIQASRIQNIKALERRARCEDVDNSDEDDLEIIHRRLDANCEVIMLSVHSDDDEPSDVEYVLRGATYGGRSPDVPSRFEGKRNARDDERDESYVAGTHEDSEMQEESSPNQSKQSSLRSAAKSPEETKCENISHVYIYAVQQRHAVPAIPLSPSHVSLSSTVTASDLPGPGRALGSFYSRAGRVLERAFDKSSKSPGTSNPYPPPSLRAPSQISISSTATMSDLPGPGRALDALYSRAGRILEQFINITAHRCGFGPYATTKRLADYVAARKNSREIYGRGVFGIIVRQVEVVEKGWMKMLRYAEHGTFKTRVTAMTHMFQLYFTVAALWNTRPHVLSATLLALWRSAQNIDQHSRDEVEIALVKFLGLQLTVLFVPCTSAKICVEVGVEHMGAGQSKKGDGMVLYDTKALQQMLADPAMAFVIPYFVHTPIFYFHLQMGVNLLAPPRPAKNHGGRLNAMVPLVKHLTTEVGQNWKGITEGPIMMGCSYDSEEDSSDDEGPMDDGHTGYGTGWDNGWFLGALQGHESDSD